MKILIIVALTILYIGATIYLYKTYGKSSKFSEKLTEIVIMETLGFVFLLLVMLNPAREYNLATTIDLLQSICFFCFFFFLFYHDYGNQEETEEVKEMNSKKEIFLHFVKKSGRSNLVITKNKKFLFFLVLYIVLEIIKAVI